MNWTSVEEALPTDPHDKLVADKAGKCAIAWHPGEGAWKPSRGLGSYFGISLDYDNKVAWWTDIPATPSLQEATHAE